MLFTLYTVLLWNVVLIVLFNCLECMFSNKAGIKNEPSLSQNNQVTIVTVSPLILLYERGLACLFFFHLHFSITFPMVYPVLSHFILPSLLGLLLSLALTVRGSDSMEGHSL